MPLSMWLAWWPWLFMPPPPCPDMSDVGGPGGNALTDGTGTPLPTKLEKLDPA